MHVRSCCFAQIKHIVFFLSPRCRPRRSLFNSQKANTLNQPISKHFLNCGGGVGMVVGSDIIPKDPA